MAALERLSRMNRLAAFWDSTVGKKIVMAVTGLIGVLFVIGHMVGQPAGVPGRRSDSTPTAHLLHGPLNELLCGRARGAAGGARAARGGGVAAHAAQPGGAAGRSTPRATPQVVDARRRARCAGAACCCSSSSSSTSSHFTTATVESRPFQEGDVYAQPVSASLQRPLVAVFYIVAMVALGAAPLSRRLERAADAGRGAAVGVIRSSGGSALVVARDRRRLGFTVVPRRRARWDWCDDRE